MEIVCDQEEFDLICQLRFSSEEIEVCGKNFRVGFEMARLQLGMEGCETVLGTDFGEAVLSPVDHTDALTRETTISAGVDGGTDGLGAPRGSMNMAMGRKRTHVRQTNQTRRTLPMTALPNAGWRVKSLSITEGSGDPLDGTAMRGERLTRIKRKSGGNRMSIVAELQVKRSSISVKPTKANRLGSLFGAANNKDAVVAMILQRAMRREAASVPQQNENTVVVSRAIVTEE